jgi:predicted dehydrogenase
MLRIGFVGSGFAARFQYAAVRRVCGVPVEVAGVWSPTREHRDKFASERNIRAFDALEALCGAVDAVSVVAPPSAHEPAAVEALKHGCHVIIEKPFTGYFGDGHPDFRGDRCGKELMLGEALASSRRMLEAERASGKTIFYAEDWVYAPAIQKEREILVKSGGQALWILAGESHSGSHSPFYGIWRYSGGGSLVGKGCHPLTAALYLKAQEGLARDGRAIRPAAVSCRTHELTRLPAFRDAGVLRTDYYDVEDYCQIHVTFSDGAVADIFSTEVVLGGVHNWMEVFANNHRTRCNVNPIDALTTYNPREEFFKDIYVVEKIGTKQGWSHPAPDEEWMNGFVQEMQDFVECMAQGRRPQCGSELGHDTVAVLYAGYLSAERAGAEVGLEAGGGRQ